MRNLARDQILLLQYLSDLSAVVAGLLIAYWLRFESGIIPANPPGVSYTSQLFWAAIIWFLCLQFSRVTLPHPRVISFNRSRRIMRASVVALLLIIVRNYFLREFDVSRLLYPVAFVTVTALVVGNRLALQGIITRFLIREGIKSRVLIIGTGPTALRIAARCKIQRELAYHLIGFVTRSPERVGKQLGGVPVLGTQEDLRRIVRDYEVHEIFVAQSDTNETEIFDIFLESERETARINVVPTLADMMRSQIHYDEVAGLPVYTLKDTPLRGFNSTIKRSFDIVVASLALITLLPLLAIIFILVKRSSPGPGLYKQSRLGIDGKAFKIYKFRTMPVGTDSVGPNFGPQDDPRATKIGRFLRLYNLDELPQLWNVIRGDMSLVGPRPEQPYFVERFREIFPRYMSRHAVKTGMTGWAQVHGMRGDTSIHQRLRYDLYYIENWSIWLDIKIIIMTLLLPAKKRPQLDKSLELNAFDSASGETMKADVAPGTSDAKSRVAAGTKF